MGKKEKYEMISKLAEDTARRITADRDTWLEYLTTAAGVYKYPFREQLLIYAQRPGATACASMEVWNKRMGCRVKRGARGIALINENNSSPEVRYVFDAADVYKTKSGQLPHRWRVETEHEQEVLAHIEKLYGRTDSGHSFETCIRELAERIADACCEEAAGAVQSVSGGSAFEEMPLPEIERTVRKTMAGSIEYIVLSACDRCGKNSNSGEKVSPEITKFNTMDVLCVLGDAMNREVKLLMQEIKRVVLSCGRDLSNSEQSLAENTDRDYNTLKRESESALQENDNIEERGADYGRTDIQMGRGLSASQYHNGRTAGGDAHEVRSAAAKISEGVQKRDIFGDATVKQAQGASAGDTGAGRGTDGPDRGADDEDRRRGRSPEGAKSDAVGAENGKHPAVSGRNRSEGDYIQLNQYKQMSLGNFLISSEEQADNTAAAEADTNHIDSAAFLIRETVPEVQNYIIPDSASGGTAKEKFRNNISAIKTLHLIETEGRNATRAEQRILAQYTGWGGIVDAFDETKPNWTAEYNELKSLLSVEEYVAARESTLNAFYTGSAIINGIYDALREMGFQKGNILDPAMGTGNFFGRLPEDMRESRLYGVELDGITGRIAGQLYPEADIKISGFEKTDYPNDFFDIAVGNVPFGQYKVADKKHDKNNFLIHDYFFAKALDKVRPGGIIAFVTSKGTMDKKSPEVRKYLAQRAELLGAVRLPNTAFKDAGTSVTSDILFLKKRDRMVAVNPEWEWLHLTEDENGVVMNQYFAEHPEMVLGKMEMVSGAHGMEATCMPDMDVPLQEQLRYAMSRISGSIDAVEFIAEETKTGECIPASADVKNYSYAIVDDRIYYREDSVMSPVAVPETTRRRIEGMVHIRDCAQALINMQLEEYPDADIVSKRSELNRLYDDFSAKYGIINSSANKRAFKGDASYCLLCSLEKTDEEGNFLGKADMFAKRTIRKAVAVTSVDTAAEALTVSLAERACVDIEYMSELAGKMQEDVTEELRGIIFKNPVSGAWETADEYLSGNVREKLAVAKTAAGEHPEFAVNVKMLEQVQPKDLDASEIEIRLGATWLPDAERYMEEFMKDVFKTPEYLFDRNIVSVQYSEVTGRWNVSGKNADTGNTLVTMTYGTERVNAYKLFEDSLNLCDVRIFDTVVADNGSEKRVLNQQATMLAGQRQEAIREAFKDWIFRDPDRRQRLCAEYNKRFNATRPREYDGSHLKLPGMTPDIELKPHQLNAVAHQLYGGNTLLAHCVGAGKTFEMAAAAMESKRLGLCRKSLFVVPNHLTEQWAGDFLRLYPGANILAATKRDFEPANRKKFCSRIATGDYDAVIIGHSQFEKIPLSRERQIATIEQQIREITMAVDAVKAAKGERYSVKEIEKTKKALGLKLSRLNSAERKDDVVTFEQLGVDRLFVDESHNYKNLFLYTKMRNVAGIAQTEAQKSSDMFAKCRYMDELTGGRGITFATGTPISNSMTELYTNMRYLQHDTLEKLGLGNFDSWAAAFGETQTTVELSPEGSGYRARTRFAKFFNLPELISLFKESADVQTPDMLKLPVPEAEYENVVLKPSAYQKEAVAALAERAEAVRGGLVEPNADNMLKITNDGRKLALDQRLINPLLPDDENSKSSVCVMKAFEIWERTKSQRLTQLIFCDLSTPKGDGTFNVYEDIRDKLMAKGVPDKEIAFIHDANTEEKKAELFAKVRSGQVRFLLGSTAKMGAGTNVQDRLIALHHLDVPWRPADIEQQNGRILRQGNINDKVKIFRYVTEGTFDSYSWQLIEIKQKFISQIMTSKSPVRSCEDVDETVLSYAEVKALATGNPYIKEKMSLDIQVSKLKVLKASYISQRYQLEDNINQKYPRDIAFIQEQIAGCRADIQIYERHKAVFSMKIGTETYMDVQKKEAGTALIEACREIYRQDADACMDEHNSMADTDVEIGQYMGFQMAARFDSFEKTYSVTLKGELRHTAYIGADALGNIQRINNALDGMRRQLEDMTLKLSVTEKQMELAREELVKPFEKEQELAEKLARLTELNVLLGSTGKVETEVKTENVNDRTEEVRTGGAGRKSVLDKLRRFQSDTGAGNRCGSSDIRRENEQIQVRNA